MSVRAVAEATGAGGSGAGASVLGIIAAVVLACAIVVGVGWSAMQVRDSMLAADPTVASARAHQAAAEADLKTGELVRQNQAEQAAAGQEARQAQQTSAIAHGVEVIALGLIPVVLIAALVGGVLFTRRHLSLPAKDGRVPLVGLDRAFSLDASQRYQALQGAGSSFNSLPVAAVEEPDFKRVWRKAVPEEGEQADGPKDVR